MLACGSTLLPRPYLSAQQNAIPPCHPWPDDPDDPRNYPENMVRPKYPKAALRSGREGTVELRATIAPDGRTKDLTVLNGDSEFSQAALAAVRKWRFHPQSVQAQPVETTFKIHVRFSPGLREANSDVVLESPKPNPEVQAVSWTAKPRLNLGKDVHYMQEPGVVAPKELYSPKPEFSENSRKAKQSGVVGIAVVVGIDGLPRDVQIACSSSPDENDNALATVKQWKFAPGTKDGKPVAVALEVEFLFRVY